MAGIPGVSGDEPSAESRLMAARVRERAATLPGPEELAAMTAEALGKPRKDMSPAEIRKLATDAIAQAQQVSHLLTRLAGLLDGPGERDA
jgi:hypothetical protein